MGFVYGRSPKFYQGSIVFMAVFSGAVIFCVMASVAGFILNAAARHNSAQVVTWLPPFGVLLALIVPPPY